MIMLPDGTSHWPIPGYAEYNKIAPVMQFQFIQKRWRISKSNSSWDTRLMRNRKSG